MSNSRAELRQLRLPLAPEYSVRISNRARFMQLKVLPVGRVEVVVPKGADLRHVPVFVEQHREWVEHALDRLHRERARLPGSGNALPERVVLPAVDEHWTVEYTTAPHHGRAGYCVSATGQGGHLRVRARSAQQGHARTCLQRWLADRARVVLVPWLRRLGDELDLTCGKVSVRAQRTRWGSCNSRGDISLNRGLLFLPPSLVRYLFVHELCHTVHMNHSRQFWALVRRCEPDYRRLDRQLHDGSRYLPLWAYPD